MEVLRQFLPVFQQQYPGGKIPGINCGDEFSVGNQQPGIGIIDYVFNFVFLEQHADRSVIQAGTLCRPDDLQILDNIGQ